MNPATPQSTDRPPTLWDSLRALPRPAWFLCFGTFLNKFGAFVVPFLTLYLTGQGYTAGEAGLAVGAYGAGTLVASLLGGHLADKLGRRQTIVLSMFLGAAMMMLLSQARYFPVIVILTALTGLKMCTASDSNASRCVRAYGLSVSSETEATVVMPDPFRRAACGRRWRTP